jgi:putative glutamine amidotransferase
MIPAIGVTTSLRTIDYYGYQMPCTILPDFYIHALSKAGCLPLLIPPCTDHSVEMYLDRVEGVLFSGGADIAPRLYGQKEHEKTKAESPARDTFELELMRRALERDMPILAICRGMQILNVALGGDLCQDIVALRGTEIVHWQELPDEEPAHNVTLTKGLIRKLFRKDQIPVNSFHHQAVDTIGKGLCVTGVSSDGIIEVLESNEHSWVIGVQWHPELMYKSHLEQLVLFEELVQKAKTNF